MVNTNFKTGFEKTAFIGAIARGAGKLTAAAGKGAKATVTGAGSLAEKARVHAKGFGEYVKKNYQAGQAGKPGVSYKGAVSNVKRQETNQLIAQKKLQQRQAREARQPAQKPAPASAAKPAAAAAAAKKGPVQEAGEKVKEFVSKTPQRIQGGAVGLAGGAYIGSKMNKQESPNQAQEMGVQYA